jgi:hypothetical protein
MLLIPASAPAWADYASCGDEPIAPVIPSPAELNQESPVDAQKSTRDAFWADSAWHGALQVYRNCFDFVDARSQGQPQSQSDQDKINKLKADEMRVASDLQKLLHAYCARPDTNKAICPKT